MPSCNPAALSEAPYRFREHYYETCDRMEAVRDPGYFVAAARFLAAGDVIRVRAGLPDALEYEEFAVEAVGDGAVTLRALTAAPREAPPPVQAAPDGPRNWKHGRGRGGRR